jgi:hypothetical protein
MSITVVINNRNLLSWPKAMVEKIQSYSSLEDILIIDNDSSYEPLLEWYDTLNIKVLKIPNIGHTSPWIPEINAFIKTESYVVTDPDLDLSETPIDTLTHLDNCLKEYPFLEKIGLGLDIKSVPLESPFYAHVNSHEKKFWNLPLINNKFRIAPIDTTFAIYNKKIMNEYKITGARMNYPYVAKHIPWNLVERSDEFNYYINEANKSSSYKTFLNL